MKIKNLHSWSLSPSDAVALQHKLREKLTQHPPLSLESARLIGGLDVSSSKDSSLLTAGVVVWDRETEVVIDTAFAQVEQTFPYVPGLLSFREIPALAKALEALKTTPDVFLVDGQGRAHPRRMGIASHIGLVLDVPTIGVAKSILTGHGEAPGPLRGESSPLMDKKEQIGTILRTRDRVSPVYVSVGNRIDLASAVDIVLACARGYRLPEPTRLAHNHVNLVRTTGKGLPVQPEDTPTLFAASA